MIDKPHRVLRAGEIIWEMIDEWCVDEVGGDDMVLEISNDDLSQLGKLVFEFLREHSQVQQWWGIKNKTSHSYVAGSDIKEEVNK
jgi:hypothetical protein